MTYKTKLEYVVYFETLNYKNEPTCHEEMARFCSIERALEYIKFCEERDTKVFNYRYVLEDLNRKEYKG